MSETTNGRFDSDGIEIAYTVSGEGEPILLIHGFASNAQTNWFGPGWVHTLTGDGRQVVTIDNRGHGKSGKPQDPAVYEAPMMAEDARRLLDHLGIGRADVMGYSMGARITAFLSVRHPERVRSAILGGLGDALIEGVGQSAAIADALEAASIEDVSDPTGREFRRFAEQTGGDLAALAACMRSGRPPIEREWLEALETPVLVCVGELDEIAGDPERLAALMPKGEGFVIPRRDHMRAVGDKAYKQAVLEFLHRRP